MTRFTVVWATDVQNDYLDGWIDADSATRNRLTAIANAIDQELAVAPEEKGSPLPLEPGCRVWRLSSQMDTRVVYEVSPVDRLVRVLRITMIVDTAD